MKIIQNVIDEAQSKEFDKLDFLIKFESAIHIVGGCRLHAIYLLREARAGYDPLYEPWEANPNEVLNELYWTESLPNIDGKVFSGINLVRTKAIGYDLSGCYFNASNLTRSEFRNCNLESSNFLHAKLGGVLFDHCNLSKVWGNIDEATIRP